MIPKQPAYLWQNSCLVNKLTLILTINNPHDALPDYNRNPQHIRKLNVVCGLDWNLEPQNFNDSQHANYFSYWFWAFIYQRGPYNNMADSSAGLTVRLRCDWLNV